MKKLRNLIAVMAMMSMAAVLTGCGDDDDDDNNDPGLGAPDIVAPATEQELTASTKTYTVNVAGQANPFTLTFPAAGQYQISENGAPTEVGTFSGATRSDNTWTMNIVPDGQEADPGILRLDFTSATQGSWTFTPTGGQAEVGQFTVTDTNPDPDPDPDPDPNPDTLTGKTLQLTAANGGGESFRFDTDTTVSYEDNTLTGTYTWDPTARRINATLSNGWVFEITIPSGSNIANVVFRESAGAEPDTTTPTYTLTGP